MARNKLWTCPECGRRFANANQWHSCLTVTVDDHFAKRPPEIRALYDRLLAIVETIGPVTVNPVKTRISFQVRMNFLAVHPRKDKLKIHLVLARALESPRFTGVFSPSPSNHVHEMEIASLDDFDAELQSWIAEAYRVGCQEHLGPDA